MLLTFNSIWFVVNSTDNSKLFPQKDPNHGFYSLCFIVLLKHQTCYLYQPLTAVNIKLVDIEEL